MIRTDIYNGVSNTLTSDDNDAKAINRRIILPSSFIGGDRLIY